MGEEGVEKPELRSLEVLGGVPDPNTVRGKRHPLSAMLSMALWAMLGAARSRYTIDQWRRDHPVLARSLGFAEERTPCLATIHNEVRRLAIDAFEMALSEWSKGSLKKKEVSWP